eukprot:gene18696-58384_t
MRVQRSFLRLAPAAGGGLPADPPPPAPNPASQPPASLPLATVDRIRGGRELYQLYADEAAAEERAVPPKTLTAWAAGVCDELITECLREYDTLISDVVGGVVRADLLPSKPPGASAG